MPNRPIFMSKTLNVFGVTSAIRQLVVLSLVITASAHAAPPTAVSGEIQTISRTPSHSDQVPAAMQIQVITRKSAIQPKAQPRPVYKPKPRPPQPAKKPIPAPRVTHTATEPNINNQPIRQASAKPAPKAPNKQPTPTEAQQSAIAYQQRLKLAAAKASQNSSYVDALIDPNIAEDKLEYSDEVGSAKDKRGRRSLSVELRARRYKTDTQQDPVEEQSIALRYSRETMNYGQFSLDLSANHRKRNNNTFGDDSSRSDTELGNFLIRQLQMPLTQTLLADNSLGIQRLSRSYLNRISTRSNLHYPLIRGAVTRIYNTSGDELVASYGKIGRYRTGLTSSYRLDSGNAATISLSKRLGKYWSLGTEAWQTTERSDDSQNRVGFGLGTGYRNKLGDNQFSALVLGDDDQRRAYSAESSQTLGRYVQRYGGYSFDENFQWLSQNIQSDVLGAYYNIAYNGGRLRSNASVDWSRFGLGQEKSVSTYAGFGMNYRLNFRNAITFSGSARDTERKLANQEGSRNYQLRSSVTRQHENNSNSRLELTHNINKINNSSRAARRSDILYGFGWSKRQMRFGLELGMSYLTSETNISARPRIGATLQQSLRSGLFISSGVRYSLSDSNRGLEQTEWSGYVNAEWELSSAWSINVEANYNQRATNQLQTGSTNLADTESNSVQLKLRYQHRSGTPFSSIGNRTGSFGSGDIVGVVFDDKNNDGVKQPLENGLEGVEVYLDRKILAITDSRGEFTYKGVYPGDHRVQVSEQTLPLPFVLKQVNDTTVNVGLRDRRFIEIPANELVE